MTFDEYLISKKIDSAAFKAAEPERWNEWEAIFGQVSAASFTSQKLYLINPIRRKYRLPEPPPEQKQPIIETKPVVPSGETPTETPRPKMNRPVFKPKIN